MLPIAPLMIEHRLIEKMVNLMTLELKRLQQGGQINQEFNRQAVDFFRVYADRTHHGKEEEILFVELEKKELSPKHQEILNKLKNDHTEARKRVRSLLTVRTAAEAIASLEFLANLYPGHIKMEDQEFFVPVMEYFSDVEKEQMLKQGQEFDQKMIHEKYRTIVEELEKA